MQRNKPHRPALQSLSQCISLPWLAASFETSHTVVAYCLVRGGLEVGAPFGICHVVRFVGERAVPASENVGRPWGNVGAQVTLDSENVTHS